MRPLLITLAILLPLSLGGYGWWSHTRAEEYAREIERNLDETTVNLKDAGLVFTYGKVKTDILSAMFSPTITVTSPKLTYNQSEDMGYIIEAEEILLKPLDAGNHEYEVLLPEHFIAIAPPSEDTTEKTTYRIQLAPIPKFFVTVTKPTKLEEKKAVEMGQTFRFYALQLPARVVMRAQFADQVRDILMNFLPVRVKVWQPIKYDVSPLIQQFFSLMDEARRRGIGAKKIKE